MLIDFPDFVLRSMEAADAEDYFWLYSHPEVARYDDFAPLTRAELQVDIDRIAGYSAESPYLELAVVAKSCGRMIGVLTIDRKRSYIYLGYHFHPDFQGKGYALRSMQALLATLTSNEQARLRIVSHPQNQASIALAGRLGFRYLKRRYSKGSPELIFGFIGQPGAVAPKLNPA